MPRARQQAAKCKYNTIVLHVLNKSERISVTYLAMATDVAAAAEWTAASSHAAVTATAESPLLLETTRDGDVAKLTP